MNLISNLYDSISFLRENIVDTARVGILRSIDPALPIAKTAASVTAATSAQGNIREILMGEPEEQHAYLIELANDLSTPEMNTEQRMNVLTTVVRMPPTKRAEIIKVALPSTNPQMVVEQRISVLTTFSVVPENLRHEIPLALPLLTPEMDAHERIDIIRSVAGAPVDQRGHVVEETLRLITPEMSGGQRLHILNAIIRALPTNVTMSTRRFITPNMDGDQRSRIIDALARIPPQQRDHVISQALRLVTGQMEDSDLIIRSISIIPAERRTNIILNALRLITQDMNGAQRSALIDALAQIVPPRNKGIKRILHVNSTDSERNQIVREILPLFGTEMNGHQRSSILQVYAGIPAEQRAVVAEILNIVPTDLKVQVAQDFVDQNQIDAFSAAYYRLITPGMNQSESNRIFALLASIAPNQRGHAINAALRLVTLNMNALQRRRALEFVANIAADQRGHVVNAALGLVGHVTNLSLAGRRDILTFVTSIAADQAEQVINVARRLITPNMNAEERLGTLTSIATIAADRREHVLSEVIRLVEPFTTPVAKLNILTFVANIAPDRRERVVHEVLRLITPNMNDEERERILTFVASIAPDRRERVVHEVLTLVQVTSPFSDAWRNILRFVTNIAADQREHVINATVRLIRPNMSTDEREYNLRFVAGLPPDQRDIVVNAQIRARGGATRILPDQRDLVVNSQIRATGGEALSRIFAVSMADFENPQALLVNYSQRVQTSMPRIQYNNEPGVDLGGLTRDFITRLFRSISTRSLLFLETGYDEGLLLKIRQQEDVAAVKAIGTLFAAALHHKSFTIGTYFHPALFQTITALNESQINGLPNNIELADLKTNYREIYETLRNTLISHLVPYAVGDQEEFIADYPEYDQRILAIAILAKSMHNYLAPQSPNGWSAVPQTSDALSDAIQGSVDRELVKGAVATDNQATTRVKAWIDTAPPEQLRQFLHAVTGSETLLPAQRLHIHEYGGQSFNFHTCSRSVDVPDAEATQEEFNVNLSSVLTGIGGRSFQTA